MVSVSTVLLRAGSGGALRPVDATLLLCAGSGVALRPVDDTLAVVACWSQVAWKRLTEHCSKVQRDGVPWQSGLDPDQDTSHAVLCALIFPQLLEVSL